MPIFGTAFAAQKQPKKSLKIQKSGYIEEQRRNIGHIVNDFTAVVKTQTFSPGSQKNNLHESQHTRQKRNDCPYHGDIFCIPQTIEYLSVDSFYLLTVSRVIFKTAAQSLPPQHLAQSIKDNIRENCNREEYGDPPIISIATLWVIASVKLLTLFLSSAIGVALPSVGEEFSASSKEFDPYN
jgi:hypothetical protein